MQYLRLRNSIRSAAIAFVATLIAACETLSPASIDARYAEVTVPYRISDAGHFLIDVSVNNASAEPFIIDSGATISALYAATAEKAGLIADDNKISVAGLVEIGQRQTISNVSLTIGKSSRSLSRMAVLQNPDISNDAAGLLGTDFLSSYCLIFNRQTQTVSFLDGKTLNKSAFSGWRRISLSPSPGGYDDIGLYFAKTRLALVRAPVLIDTGSDTNFVNWPLAEMDDEIRKMKRSLNRAVKLQGALGTTKLRMQTKFFDVTLGNQNWPVIPIVIMDFDTLANVAPVNAPMMVAGAAMFSGRTFAFDFAGGAIYIYPEHAAPQPER